MYVIVTHNYTLQPIQGKRYEQHYAAQSEPHTRAALAISRSRKIYISDHRQQKWPQDKIYFRHSLFISNPTHTILNKLDLGYIIMEKDVTKNKKHKKKKRQKIWIRQKTRNV